MACFRFLHNGYDTEVIYRSDIHMHSGIDITLFLLLWVDIVVCDLYFDSHILFGANYNSYINYSCINLY